MHSPAKWRSWQAWDRLSRGKKTLAVAVWTVAMLSLLYLAYLSFDYSARMPAQPQPATGRIYAFEYKNRILYVTAAEQRRYRTATAVTAPSQVTS